MQCFTALQQSNLQFMYSLYSSAWKAVLIHRYFIKIDKNKFILFAWMVTNILD